MKHRAMDDRVVKWRKELARNLIGQGKDGYARCEGEAMVV